MNVTPLAKIFNKDQKEFFRLKSTSEYIEALNEFLIRDNPTQSIPKLKYTKRGKETHLNKGTFGTYIMI